MIKIGKDISKFSTCAYKPRDFNDLRNIINDRISKDGPNCNLNDIDVSNISKLSGLFYDLDFNGDISEWDVSNVDNMAYMFRKSEFNQDISNWDVSNVINMSWMFNGSKFDKNISKWKLRKDCVTTKIF